MSATELILRDPLGERALSAADFPVSVGGPGHTIVLPGAGADTLAWLALHDGQLFLQPAAGREPRSAMARPCRVRPGCMKVTSSTSRVDDCASVRAMAGASSTSRMAAAAT